MECHTGQSGQHRVILLSSFRAALAGLFLFSLFAAGAIAQSWETDILHETFGYGADTPADVPWDEVRIREKSDESRSD